MSEQLTYKVHYSDMAGLFTSLGDALNCASKGAARVSIYKGDTLAAAVFWDEIIYIESEIDEGIIRYAHMFQDEMYDRWGWLPMWIRNVSSWFKAKKRADSNLH